MAKFFHIQKSKRFSYKPRYYNEMKEQRLEREKEIIKDVEAEKLGKSRLTKEDMANYIKMARRTQKKSNVTLVIILAILIAISYLLFYK